MQNWFLIILFIALITFPGAVSAQEEDKFITINTPLTIDLDEEEEEESPKRKKKKRKKKVFYDLKTKKGFTKKGYGNDIEIEVFYYLKDPVPVDPYVRDIYWYDFRRKQIRKSGKVDEEYGVVLHGPYKKMIGEKVIEEGIFYKGTKHGRWTKYNKNDILVDKNKYYKGWPKESLVRYYDKDRQKLREIIPVEYGKKEGNYFYFYESGNVAVSGEYHEDQKVGEWIEYWPVRGRRKKIIQYRKDPYNDSFKPYIVKEWNKDGSLVYDRKEWEKRVKYDLASVD